MWYLPLPAPKSGPISFNDLSAGLTSIAGNAVNTVICSPHRIREFEVSSVQLVSDKSSDGRQSHNGFDCLHFGWKREYHQTGMYSLVTEVSLLRSSELSYTWVRLVTMIEVVIDHLFNLGLLEHGAHSQLSSVKMPCNSVSVLCRCGFLFLSHPSYFLGKTLLKTTSILLSTVLYVH